jgi:hypothetical protein
MAQEEYGKRARDLTVEQLESEIHKALAQAVPADAIRNMPIGRIEEAHDAALMRLGFVGLTINCKVVCTFVYPPGKVECRVECNIVF